MNQTLLVVGATGIVGGAALKYFSSLAGWEVVALSRRPITPMNNVRYVHADLTDFDGCRNALMNEKNITHILYAALYEKPNLVAGWSDKDQMDLNLVMFKNLVIAVESVAPNLKKYCYQFVFLIWVQKDSILKIIRFVSPCYFAIFTGFAKLR